MKLLVTGGSGLLGSDVVRAAVLRGWKVAAPSRSEMDIVDGDSCLRVIKSDKPDYVIHCAAFTAVDKAETEPEQAMRVNRDGSANVARAAALSGSGLVHISTDYVFDGLKGSPYEPDDPVSPLSAYASSKVAAETAVMEEARSGAVSPLIVRTGWLYGAARRDFIDMVLENAQTGVVLKIVDDQRGRPSWTRNVAEAVLDLIELGARGIVNVSDRGEATWFEFAKSVLNTAGLSPDVQGVSTQVFGALARRPLYSVLDVTATELTLKRRMMPWHEALKSYMSERSGT